MIFSKYSLAMVVFEARGFHVLAGLPKCEVYEVLNPPVVLAVSYVVYTRRIRWIRCTSMRKHEWVKTVTL